MASTTTFDSPASWPNGRPPVVFSTESKWDHIFSSFTLDHQVQEKYAEAILELKEEARSMLTMAEGKTVSERLVLIDTLERLGVGYHFDQQIEYQLEDILIKFDLENEGYDLFTTALLFRILRQHRHYISCNVFDKFIDQDKRFKESLSDDAEGLLSLYEAVHLRIHGEQILDEALTFTVHHLKRMVQQLESPLQDLVKRALERPLHRGLPRMETRHYISSYEKYDSKNQQLLKLAKLDFNYVQNIYKEELHKLTRWWNELNPHLPYARNRVVAAYLWGVAFHFEPQWNIDEIDCLPDYMKPIYKCVLKMYDEYEREAVERGKPFAIPYAKQTMKDICSAYNQGLKYTMGGPITSFEDYIQMTAISSIIYVGCAATFPGLESLSEEAIDWFKNEPKIIRPLAEVCRYLDDVGSYERESQEGALLTGLDFYVKYHGGSVEEAKIRFEELAEDAWKRFNTEWVMNLKSSGVPKEVVEELLGYVRAADVVYRDSRDGYAKCHIMAPEVEGLFIDHIIV
ncbi:Alpha-humulene/(-)-(E)-beta-caryophyllene synthase [Striga hermonthica]|uniref:Alpha-humulene/(-)-(E)-beta-caryophyllene synthase n=1 Tax=Striga hermonthica TaxID=68872 RepID=A0A9N7MEX5_STRHE|nr:Alpha-humulene/(-)-(E)-beta-caryophyllene synthase [Striga hermonthica]